MSLQDRPESVARARQLFDDALAQSFDELFAAPDIVDVVAAVAEGDLAILISGDSLKVVTVSDVEQDEAPKPADKPEDDFMPGMYL